VTELPLSPTRLESALDDLRKDLLSDDGPRISTMRNYRFAIVPYRPEDELHVQQHARRLADDMKTGGWHVLSIDLARLLAARVRAEGGDWLERIIAREKRLSARNPERGLNVAKDALAELVAGAGGIADDIAGIISGHVESDRDGGHRTVALIGRAGAMYPFGRMSALLKHLDGRTCGIPVVLLYPGTHSQLGLSFMGLMPPDPDYRPRIYK